MDPMVVVDGMRVDGIRLDDEAGTERFETVSLRLHSGSAEPSITTLDLAFHEGQVPAALRDTTRRWNLRLLPAP